VLVQDLVLRINTAIIEWADDTGDRVAGWPDLKPDKAMRAAAIDLVHELHQRATAVAGTGWEDAVVMNHVEFDGVAVDDEVTGGGDRVVLLHAPAVRVTTRVQLGSPPWVRMRLVDRLASQWLRLAK
jgi:hypothetical protein